MTSVPDGTHLLDINHGFFGLVNANSSRFDAIGTLPGPFSSHAFAQVQDGNSHYVNGDGAHYKKHYDFMRNAGTAFPADVQGVCGDFDGSDVVAGISGETPGAARHSLLKQTSPATCNERRVAYFNDVATGPLDDRCASDDFTGASYYPGAPVVPGDNVNEVVEDVVDANLARAKKSHIIDLEKNFGITCNNVTENFYAI